MVSRQGTETMYDSYIEVEGAEANSIESILRWNMFMVSSVIAMMVS